MNIERKQSKSQTRFGNIRQGVVFEYNSSLFLKIEPIERTDGFGSIINAVTLSGGSYAMFKNQDNVLLVSGAFKEE